jgi:menaquinol-cytochrome c reductase iron-sulfur subunit
MNNHQLTARAVSPAGGGPANAGRRSFLVKVIAAIHAAMGATLAFVIGGAALAPSFRRRDESWLHAAPLSAVRENEPLAVTLRIARQDGYSQVVDRKVVYLLRQGDQVRAMGSTCTHLGCRTTYDKPNKRIICPCHGGVYDLEGKVVSGPPPAPLPSVATRVEGDHILVQV